MAIRMTLEGYTLLCDKCGGVIRHCLAWLTEESVRRLRSKFKACPRCMERRRTRDQRKAKRATSSRKKDHTGRLAKRLRPGKQRTDKWHTPSKHA